MRPPSSPTASTSATTSAASGATRVFVAPQAVDNAFWSAPAAAREDDRFSLSSPGARRARRGSRCCSRRGGAPALMGSSPWPAMHRRIPPDVVAAGRLDPLQLRNLFAVADVVAVPSLVTRRFIEPWGLVVNEAMNQGAAILATDAVGAAAGGLVRDGRNGLIVPAGDAEALAGALVSLAADRARCAALGAAGREDVAGFTFDAWADGFAGALEFAVSHARPGVGRRDAPPIGASARCAARCVVDRRRGSGLRRVPEHGWWRPA